MFYSSIIISQSVEQLVSIDGNTSFLIGNNAEIKVENWKKFFNTEGCKIYYNEDHSTSISFTLIKLYTNTNGTPIALLSMDIPNLKKLIGVGEKIEFSKPDTTLFATIEIYAGTPQILSYKVIKPQTENLIFKSYQELQTIELVFNKYTYVDSVYFTDAGFNIQGKNENKDTLSISFFTTDIIKTELVIDYYPKNSNGIKQIKKFNLDRIKIVDANNVIQFNVDEGEYIYIDDLQEGLSHELLFNFNGEKLKGLHEIVVKDASNYKFDKEFYQLNDEDKCNASLITADKSGDFEIDLIPVVNYTKKTYTATLSVLPAPNITKVQYLSLENNLIQITREENAKYVFTLVGEKLNKMDDLTSYLKNVNSGNEIKLNYKNNNLINEREYELIMKNVNTIDTGAYKIILRRTFKGRTRDYECHVARLNIIEPKKKLDQVKKIDFIDPDYTIKKKEYNDKLINKSQYVLDEKSPLKFELKLDDDNKIIYGTQFLDVDLRYTRINGTIETKSIRNYRLTDPVQVIDIKQELNMKRLDINESIDVSIKHSEQFYGENQNSNIYYLQRGLKFEDKIGLTVSLPPYLVAVRNVRRKTIIKDESGNITDVKYDGSYELEGQSLLVNAGIGIKFRDQKYKNGDYAAQRWAVGLYFMGLDMANQQSSDELINNEKDYSFIARGSFNILFLGEWSVINLDNVNTKIPIYLGSIFIPQPLDDGKKLALAAGIGIDIRLTGSK